MSYEFMPLEPLKVSPTEAYTKSRCPSLTIKSRANDLTFPSMGKWPVSKIMAQRCES
jgi:hypothetical protein